MNRLQEFHEDIPGLDRFHVRTRMTGVASSIHLARGDAVQADTRTFGTPDRAVCIPNLKRCAGKVLSVCDDGNHAERYKGEHKCALAGNINNINAISALWCCFCYSLPVPAPPRFLGSGRRTGSPSRRILSGYAFGLLLPESTAEFDVAAGKSWARNCGSQPNRSLMEGRRIVAAEFQPLGRCIMPSANSVSRSLSLEAAGSDLVRRLGGVWHGTQGMCRCPAHDDRSPSLSVRIGCTSLLFKCFAGCDTIDVLRAIRRLSPETLDATGTGEAQTDDRDEWLQGRARDLWSRGRPLDGTLAEIYLRNRAISILPPVLRFCPRTPLGKGELAMFRPALLAAVTDESGLLAVQRTFLDEDGRRARDLDNPRWMLGRPKAGAVRLAPATDELGLAEGVETAISAMILLGIPVWAALGNERFPHVDVPRSVKRLVLLPDNDRAGHLAVPLTQKALATEGRRIELLWPWHDLNDWNDVLRMDGGKGAEAGVR